MSCNEWVLTFVLHVSLNAKQKTSCSTSSIAKDFFGLQNNFSHVRCNKNNDKGI